MPFPAIMASGLVRGLVANLASAGPQIALKIMTSLGFGYLAYTGADTLVANNESQVLTLLSTLPLLAQQLLGVLQIGTCIKIVFSALVMRLAIIGLNEGVIKRMKVI
jgi:hypothetical protein